MDATKGVNNRKDRGLADRFSKELQVIDPRINPEHFREFVTDKFLKRNPKMVKQPGRVIDSIVEVELDSNFFNEVSRYQESNEVELRSSSLIDCIQVKKLTKLIEEKESVFGEECEKIEKEIDRAIESGGRTKLHISAEAGDYSGCIDLIENHGASVLVKDMMGYTPAKRARLMGHHDLHNYLLSYSDCEYD